MDFGPWITIAQQKPEGLAIEDVFQYRDVNGRCDGRSYYVSWFDFSVASEIRLAADHRFYGKGRH